MVITSIATLTQEQEAATITNIWKEEMGRNTYVLQPRLWRFFNEINNYAEDNKLDTLQLGWNLTT